MTEEKKSYPCNVCHKETTKLCSECKGFSFCSDECQKIDSKMHKISCISDFRSDNEVDSFKQEQNFSSLAVFKRIDNVKLTGRIMVVYDIKTETFLIANLPSNIPESAIESKFFNHQFPYPKTMVGPTFILLIPSASKPYVLHGVTTYRIRDSATIGEFRTRYVITTTTAQTLVDDWYKWFKKRNHFCVQRKKSPRKNKT